MKRLILDIETAPNRVYTWGLYNQNIAINQIDKPGYILCWAAKWHGKPKVHFASLQTHSRLDMLKGIFDLISEADVVIHYNGQRFDIPTLNQEFIKVGLSLPSPFKHIDLLRTARKQFRLPSNKLSYVASYLDVGEKTPSTGFNIWTGCMNGDIKSWKVMKKYNINDVRITEKVYDILLPWITNHPNFAFFVDKERPVCTNCGSTHLQKRGFFYTKTLSYQRYHCQDCGTWMRERLATKREMKNTLVGI